MVTMQEYEGAVETTIQTTTTNDIADWQDYKLLFNGQSKDMVTLRVARRFQNAYSRGQLTVEYLPIFDYMISTAAGAYALRPNIQGTPSWVSLINRSLDAIRQAWELRYAAGASYLHLAFRSGQPHLECVWPDSVKVEADPLDPLNWSAILSATITTAGGDLVYRRDGSSWLMMYGESEPVRLPALPLWQLRKKPGLNLNPPCDMQLADLVGSLGCKLSEIEFRRVFRTSITFRKTDTGGESLNPLAPKTEVSADTIQELRVGEDFGVVESNLKPLEDLEYVVEWLRLAALLMGLPPELLESRSRAETGAAKEVDWAPLKLLRSNDRSSADNWFAGWVLDATPLLRQYGVEPGTVKAVEPATGYPGDIRSWVEAIDMLVARGATTWAYEMSKVKGYPLGSMESLIADNMQRLRRVNNANNTEVAKAREDTRANRETA